MAKCGLALVAISYYTARTKRILVTTDFSEDSYKALGYGAALVKKFGAALYVVHVAEIDYAIPSPASGCRNPI